MGDVVDSIMEGVLCQECGVYIDDNDQGFPRSCSGCKPNKNKSNAKKRKLRTKKRLKRQQNSNPNT